ncbi:MAG: phosphatidylinositol-specific phospholipase C1-like protein [Bryobacteraceae bacterium]
MTIHLRFACFLLLSAHAPAQILLNQIQVIGSHNSYHIGLAPSETAWLRQLNPKSADALDYQHPGLDVQLSAGVRQVEIDIYADAEGGRYAHPANLKMIADAGLPADPPFDPNGLFVKPGFKVMHAQDIDYRSNCQLFTGCLAVILNWSKAHPGHLPIFILIETKVGKARPFQVEPEPFTTAAFDALDKEIRSVIPANKMIVPDQIRGKHETLEEAVLAGAWPTLASARGKVIFLLDQRKAGPDYVAGHPSLKGRVIFTNAEPGTPDAAFVEQNDPLKDPTLIPGLVKKGYLVRTRTDGDTVQARSGETQQRDAAMASGAQMLSSDYYFNEKSRWTDYSVNFPNGEIARCNPLFPSCTGLRLP